ncbi:hypothetical protein MAC_08925 [Metarhizium acridum CQMa 102]|uniref:Uncharacterized protein n=1 Tax=Metarhizium acridum (strain CQMa 102) TaxID=655827 RepID=E9EGC7_METAQ|nr:uncharacterized protein MAC_08925 [Metarhizium acridum CQMa 102]EFY85042.1 hypothetical protein MAC_08925 [Metarhizium acridum CQMa 102]
MTDQALVACRYTTFEEDPDFPFAPAQLTTDLALWWLCMLAVSAHSRSSVEHEIVPISKWDVEYYDDERGWVRRHKYSGYKEPTEAPSPPAYETPASDDGAGNAALFMAGVGLNVL